MESLMKALSPAHQTWFANMAIHAIWADGRIALSEFENFQRLLSLMKNLGDKTQLIRKLENNQADPLTLPEDIDRSILPEIYLELVNFAICDWDLADEEKAFLDELAALFDFSRAYRTRTLQWAQEGLRWQEDQKLLLPREVELTNSRVPLHRMDVAQKIWYAEVLIGAVMIDGIVDDLELKLLRTALNFVDDAVEKRRLVGFVKNRLRPSLLSPPNLDFETIYLIFFEVLRVLSLNDDLANKEVLFIGDYVRACNLPILLEERALVWCKRGISWRQKRKGLAKVASFGDGTAGSSLSKSEDRWLPHPESNALLFREQGCYACDSEQPVRVYRLRPKSQKSRTNLFGVPYYLGPMTEKDDALDYSRIKVHICPECYFASTQKEMFRPKEAARIPTVFSNREFLRLWSEGKERRKAEYRLIEEERDLILPGLAHVQTAFELAMHSIDMIQRFKPEEANVWLKVDCSLTLAEQLMQGGQNSEAERYLMDAERMARDLMLSTRDNLLSLKAARLLFQVALYQGNQSSASNYLNFFIRLKDDKFKDMEGAEKSHFTGVFNEVKRDFEDREELNKTKLDGFHRPTGLEASVEEPDEDL
ncbi:MAG: hypothetical protein RRB13_02210 [bacterium]|nr:hypothetical protein [bacterium]